MSKNHPLFLSVLTFIRGLLRRSTLDWPHGFEATYTAGKTIRAWTRPTTPTTQTTRINTITGMRRSTDTASMYLLLDP
ncbi:MAG: hypothetical protein JKY53_13380 [Flavobacteriales bacterium]|nr:hypothetical protein [Flavobacteriales bacterium]